MFFSRNSQRSWCHVFFSLLPMNRKKGTEWPSVPWAMSTWGAIMQLTFQTVFLVALAFPGTFQRNSWVHIPWALLGSALICWISCRSSTSRFRPRNILGHSIRVTRHSHFMQRVLGILVAPLSFAPLPSRLRQDVKWPVRTSEPPFAAAAQGGVTRCKAGWSVTTQ